MFWGERRIAFRDFGEVRIGEFRYDFCKYDGGGLPGPPLLARDRFAVKAVLAIFVCAVPGAFLPIGSNMSLLAVLS